MKKLIAFLLALALVLSLAACGKDDPNAGRYEAVSCSALGFAVDCDGDWLELKKGGRGTLRMQGEEYACSWTLEGEDLTIKNHGDEFYGTLENGIIIVDFAGLNYTFMMEGEEQEDGGVKGHEHRWQDATCLNSAVCTDCGETRGEPLGHTATEANYQQPSVCSVCGEVLAEVLVPDMVKYGWDNFMELGVTYEYDTCCNANREVRTLGEVTVQSYDIFDEAEGYPAKEGYEWRVVVMQALFSDYSARGYGVMTDTNYEDYYTIELHDDSAVYDEERLITTYSVLYNGEIMEVTSSFDGNWSDWFWQDGRKICYRTVTWTFCVPKGYDGIVVGFRDASSEWLDDTYLYDYDPADFLLFRLY